MQIVCACSTCVYYLIFIYRAQKEKFFNFANITPERKWIKVKPCE